MRVLVDTCVWSEALRRGRRSATPVAEELRNLITEHRVEIVGPIRQEILSGVRNEAQFGGLETRLGAFPDIRIASEDYVTAARFFNLCRTRGVQGSNTDFLICAIAARHKLAIFTTDRDFLRFAKHLPITLHEPRGVQRRGADAEHS